MSYNIDFSLATSPQIEAALCKRLEEIRLSRNTTQTQLAALAGVSTKTIGRLEKGQGVSLNTFIRVMTALGIQQNLAAMMPDPTVRPIERIRGGGGQRKRARPGRAGDRPETWTWGDGGDEEERGRR